MDRDLRRALGYVVPHWKRLAIVVVLSLASTVAALYIPYLARLLIDGALLGGNSRALVTVILRFGALTLGSFALNVVSGLVYTRASADILFEMRLGVFRQLHRLSPRFYADMPVGQIATRINADIGEIQRVAAEIALAWLGNVIFLVGSVVILTRLDRTLFLVSLAVMPLALWALVRYRSRMETAVAGVRDRSADVGSYLIEALLGMKVIVAFNAQEREASRFRANNDAFIDALMSMRRLTYLSGGVPGLLLSAGSALVFLVGGMRVIDHSITMGTLVAFVAYQMRLVWPIQALMGLYASLASARVSLKRVSEILDARVDVVDSPTAVAVPSVQGRLILEDVTYTFGRRGPVLHGVSLDVSPGERVAIVGRSGEGKSTIADLLVRQLDPDSGRVLLDGLDLRAARLADVRRHVLVVDQDPFVFNATIAENIRYARPAASDDEVRAAAEAAGLGSFISLSPRGLQTSAGERGRALSAGERQRLALARAFLADPAVLVLDEATGALDPATEAQVAAGYEAVMAGRTTIIITHRLELARRADRVLVLERGRIVEEGTAATLLDLGQSFASLFSPGTLAETH
ncbi:MAG TPA: ABC transporter ATP-binding protein [Gemmatimonadaceae bacterium]|nr:ABC transporter ATP-binding protein [Gemmatimonadaceae bacterium]